MTRLLFCLLAVLVSGPARAQESTPPASLPELKERLEGIVNHPKYAAALWGVKAVSLDTGKTVFEHHANRLLSPASNSKLYTVALALDRLGGEYRIKTTVFAAAKPDRRGTLKGDLILYGRGDPTINARLHDSNVFNALLPLVAALTNAGLRQVTGDLVADESFFRGPEFGSGWAWDDAEYYYGAEISALTINDNTFQVSVSPGEREGAPCRLTLIPPSSCLTLANRTRTAAPGSRRTISFYRPLGQNILYASGQLALGTNTFTDDVTVHSPARIFGSWFKEALASHGVRVKGGVRVMNWLDRQARPLNCDGLFELAGMDSLPLGVIAREVQKPSQNLYTDLLLAHVGERFRSEADPQDMTSEDLGIRELNRFLAEAGVKKGDVLFEEGSGLSRNNLTTADATVALLAYMSRHACADAYINALPLAGVDGTLRNRMKNTPAAGKLRGKTGSLRWASSLSGYVTSAAGERLVFSLMLNRYNGSTPSRADLDAIAVLLAQFTGRTAAE